MCSFLTAVRVQGGHFSLSNSHSRSSSFMISRPSTQTSQAYSSSQKFTLAEMDQQLGALMSDEPMWSDAPAGLAADPFSVTNLSIPSNSSSKMEGLSWDSPGLHIDDVGVRCSTLVQLLIKNLNLVANLLLFLETSDHICLLLCSPARTCHQSSCKRCTPCATMEASLWTSRRVHTYTLHRSKQLIWGGGRFSSVARM